MKIEMRCCEGEDRYRGDCLKNRCPIYDKAEEQLKPSHRGYTGTGFGNLNSSGPSHESCLSQVRYNLLRALKQESENPDKGLQEK
ncbi:MAG: hypothetical protein Q7R43_04810 [Candidatus Daviesbacteria bacterium]|nr:hypothetical protein [Candidatus Daviesbacteria bacterium]